MIELKLLTAADVDAHNAGEDHETVKWLTGEFSTTESTHRHFETLAQNAARGEGKRAFGIWVDARLAGYVDFDPTMKDLPAAGDVNIAYSVHPWARRRGAATVAVGRICDHISEEGIGTRAIARIEAGNFASSHVVERNGCQLLGEFQSIADQHEDGSPTIYNTYCKNLTVL